MNTDRGEEDEPAGTGRRIARNAIDAGRDLYRQGAMAVVRSGGDSGTLMLLAAGGAIASVSWLLVRRRARKPRA